MNFLSNPSFIRCFCTYIFISILYRLRESIDEMRRSLEAKENALEGLQHSIFDKEQVDTCQIIFIYQL